MEFYNKCKSNSIKPIIGVSIEELNIIIYATKIMKAIKLYVI
jgi:DNA polymerase III alpha subunit